MKRKLNCILLVDDDKDCIFFHQRLLKKLACAERIEVATDGMMALDFLKAERIPPSIIFLDINMPGMDGWEFLKEYEKLPESERAKIVVIMLSSSLNPDDKIRAEKFSSVKDLLTKYLNRTAVEELLLKHFPDHFLRPAT
jgi:CheY-like chemotaxis protein